MNDAEMNDDPTTLASAYLDGHVTPSERAQVDADPTLVAEVERLRQVRAVLIESDGPPISVRERHLAGALDVWDRLPAAERTGEFHDATPAGGDAAAAAGAATITAPVHLRDRRGRRSGNTKMLAVAAGLVVVLAGGLVVRTITRTTDSGPSLSADAPAAEAPLDLDARAALDEAAADETFGGGGAEPDLFEEERVDAAAESPAVAANNGDTFIGGGEGSADDDLEVLASVEDLAIFASDIRDAAASAAETALPAADAGALDDTAIPPGTAFPLCDLVDTVVGPALWHQGGLFNEEIVVGIDASTGDAIAYRPTDCFVVARTPLPTP
jgi:hypothetical protein